MLKQENTKIEKEIAASDNIAEEVIITDNVYEESVEQADDCLNHIAEKGSEEEDTV